MQYACVASIITEGQPQWAVMKSDIHRHELKYEARMLLDLASCPLFQPLDKTWRAEGVIDLATKTDKDAPAFRRLKLTPRPSDPPTTEMFGDAPVSPMAYRRVSSLANGHLKNSINGSCSYCSIVEVSQSYPSHDSASYQNFYEAGSFQVGNLVCSSFTTRAETPE
ncbi:hypothetical protein HAX54_014257 [Datura stramonium]|uniref:Uncharacterized protein n=1 Tax=Datura stramonium TaxID=4076 RepID=A0ABS8Y4V8_DATST|nr:hypothetical protein [Datura stramonium]